MSGRVIRIGCWGVDDGDNWDMGIATHIKNITIYCGNKIYGIEINYLFGDSLYKTPTYGNPTGQRCYIDFEDDEYITAVSGHYNETCLTQLSFVTSRKETFGPYGAPDGTSFSLPITKGTFVGFIGRANKDYLTAIGVDLVPN